MHSGVMAQLTEIISSKHSSRKRYKNLVDPTKAVPILVVGAPKPFKHGRICGEECSRELSEANDSYLSKFREFNNLMIDSQEASEPHSLGKLCNSADSRMS